MTIRAGKINGKNLNYVDQDNSALDYALVNSGIIEGMQVTAGQVSIGRAILITKRTSVTPNQKFGIHLEITSTVTIDTTGTKKVWIALDPQYVNDGTLATNPTGSQLASIQTGASYPADSSYYIPLASITSGTITDARVFINMKALLASGYTPGYMKEIDPTTGNEVLRAIASGSGISSTDILSIINPVTRARKEIPYSDVKSDITGSISSEYDNTLLGAESIPAYSTLGICKNILGGVTDYPVGDATARTSLSFPFLFSGNTGGVDIYIKKVSTPTDNMVFEICSDNSGNPGTVLKTVNIGGASIQTYGVKQTISLSGVTANRGDLLYIRVSRSSAVSGSLYFVVLGTSSTNVFFNMRTYNGTTYSTSSVLAIGGVSVEQNLLQKNISGVRSLYGFSDALINKGGIGKAIRRKVVDFAGVIAGTLYDQSSTAGAISSTLSKSLSIGYALRNDILEYFGNYIWRGDTIVVPISYSGSATVAQSSTFEFPAGGSISLIGSISTSGSGYSTVAGAIYTSTDGVTFSSSTAIPTGTSSVQITYSSSSKFWAYVSGHGIGGAGGTYTEISDIICNRNPG